MKFLIVIPTYNEIDNIERLLGRLMNVSPDIEVLVVDDGSPDGTGALVKGFTATHSRIHLLERTEKNGIGPAYIAGFKWALERDYEAIIEMDADLSHRPRYLPKFFKEIKNYDMVVGSRWMPGGRIANWPVSRVILSRLANIYCKWILQVPIYDMTGGFVCYRRALLESIDFNAIKSDGYSFQIEMKFRALCLKYRLFETPITFTDRKAGSSKISKKIVYEALFMVLYLKIRGWMGAYNKPAHKNPQPQVYQKKPHRN